MRRSIPPWRRPRPRHARRDGPRCLDVSLIRAAAFRAPAATQRGRPDAAPPLCAISVTHPRTRSSMALPFLDQQVHDVDSDFEAPGQRHAIERGGAGWRRPNPERGLLPDRDDLCDRSIAVRYRDSLAAPNSAKVRGRLAKAKRGWRSRPSNMLLFPIGKQ